MPISKLSNNEILNYTIFEESLDGIVFLDLNTQKFIKYNKRVCELYGYSFDEFKNISPKELTLEFVSDEMMKEKQNYILNKGWDKFITKHKTKDNKIIDVFVKSKVIDYENNILYITLHDLTKEKQLEILLENKIKEKESLLKLFDKGNVYLFKFNNDKFWSVDYVSKNIQDLCGFDYDEFVDKRVLYKDLICKNYIDKFNDEIDYAMNNSINSISHQPYKIITKDKTVKWILSFTQIIKNADNIEHFLGYVVDITDLKNYEQNLEELVSQKVNQIKKQENLLQQKNKMEVMGEMMSIIAHQWKSPLSLSNINILVLKELNNSNELQKEQLQNKLEQLENLNIHMSKTMQSFLSYFNPNKKRDSFYVSEIYKEVYELIKI